MIKEKVQTLVKTTNKEVRYLGVWITSKQLRKIWIFKLNNIVKDFLKVCEKKSLRIGHIAYLFNWVLIPRLLHTAQLMTLKEHEWDLIFKPMLDMVKHQL